LNPWQEPGLSVLEVPAYVWREHPRGLIEGFAVSDFADTNDRITQFVSQSQQHRKFGRALEYNSVPVMLEQASFRKSHIMVGEKLLLSGASATRLQNAYIKEREGVDPDAEQHLIDYFARCQQRNVNTELARFDGPLGPDIAFAIECRNTFNYFHFITESLCQMEVVARLRFEGPIYFHFPNSEDKRRGFARAFVDTLYPEYADRVRFERAPKDYDRVLSAYDLIGGHYQNAASGFDQIDTYAPTDHFWKGREAVIGSQSILAMNCINTNILGLRARALRAIKGTDFSHLPKRFYVGRDAEHSRARPMEGEEKLLKQLAELGFDYVVFERLSPLEQIALMANAEIMVSHHGAGFTNMLFANPDAWVIEIGTLQTAVSRWGFFWPLANAAGCRYVTFFADYNGQDPDAKPHLFKDDILPVALSAQGIAQIVGFVGAVVGDLPKLTQTDDLARLARQLFQVREFARAAELLAAHEGLMIANLNLCLLRADCHKQLDEPKSELVALDRAYRADTTRWQTLIRMIWCANRCERPQVIRWALSRLHDEFPTRHDAFVKNHQWVRYVV